MINTENIGTRKIQKTGGASYTTTLPKKWIQTNQLDENEEVTYFIHPFGTVCFAKERSAQLLTAIIQSDLGNKKIERELLGAYVAGANQIIIHGSAIDLETKQLVRRNTTKLAGFDLFENTSEKIVLKYVANNQIPAKDYLLKSFAMIENMLTDTVIAVTTYNRRLAADIIDRDEEIDKINLIIIRQFNQFIKSLIPLNSDESLTVLNYYKHIAIRLERMADHIVRICITLLQIKNRNDFILAKQEIKLFEKIIENIKQAEIMVIQLNKKMAHTLIDDYEQSKKNAFINKKINNENSSSIIVKDSLERMRSYLANIAEETIDYVNLVELVKR